MSGVRVRPTRRVPVTRVHGDRRRPRERDAVAAEEPMEIRLLAGPPVRPPSRGGHARGATVAVTMRTPGNDFELAAGFLHSEGIVAGREELLTLRYCSDEAEEARYNIVNVHLRAPALPPIERLERHFTMTSACGVCGKAHLDALEVRCPAPPGPGPVISADVLETLPDRLREAQAIFGRTGGLHAAGLFTPDGELLAIREDVGRHNALDKLLGWALLEDKLPLADQVLCVSGRASFELLQKAVAAGAPFFAAVSAPSSLAVEVAERFGVTLVGFLRGERFNVYSGEHRVSMQAPARRTDVRRAGSAAVAGRDGGPRGRAASTPRNGP
ncbi:MAG: formate dehydrogenase accessory sulfurtransferase FdhD [Deinococcales bacterium]